MKVFFSLRKKRLLLDDYMLTSVRYRCDRKKKRVLGRVGHYLIKKISWNALELLLLCLIVAKENLKCPKFTIEYDGL